MILLTSALFAVFNFVALQTLSRSRVDANISLAQEYGKVSGAEQQISLRQQLQNAQAQAPLLKQRIEKLS